MTHSRRRKAPGTHVGNPSYAQSDPRYARYTGDGDGFGTLADKAPSTRDGISIPEADPKWKPSARSWFNSLKLSGQSAVYEASDWATAVAAAEAYNIWLRTYNASTLAQFVRLSERLGCTIVDRKRGRISLSDPKPSDADEDAADDAVHGWQSRLYVVPEPGADPDDDQ